MHVACCYAAGVKNLDEVVLDALDLHASYALPKLKFKPTRKRLVVASGNALPTGKVVFKRESCVFADEGQFREVLKREPALDAAVVISASGKKHAPLVVEELLARGLDTCLLTCNGASDAAKLLPSDHVFVTKSKPEPITYNTSTYMGMMLAKTRENPRVIKAHLLRRVKPLLRQFNKYRAFYLIVPGEFDLMREMFITKFDELFGPKLLGRCYTEAQTFHAKTVVPWDKELFISFGFKNRHFGLKRLTVPLPPNAGFVSLMATGYYAIGHIQAQFPPWFKRHAETYAQFQRNLPF